ncbi:hypothetical protein EVAR_70766_1 [Eumeta japonica]|uniref:Uncharacterized protein n=1 Tax=Eumeta variegata TaxID=151549 RepID=A0A4C2A3K4_EUMVA|nr:hypothetical protein EVAR_70766_1 [Eumeta japonica]
MSPTIRKGGVVKGNARCRRRAVRAERRGPVVPITPRRINLRRPITQARGRTRRSPRVPPPSQPPNIDRDIHIVQVHPHLCIYFFVSLALHAA